MTSNELGLLPTADPGEPRRVLMVAYACGPDRGSEPGVGWHRALEMAKHKGASQFSLYDDKVRLTRQRESMYAKQISERWSE